MPPRRYALLAAIDVIAVAALFLFIVGCSKDGGGTDSATPLPAPAPAPDAPTKPTPPPRVESPCDETKIAARDLRSVCRPATPTPGGLEAEEGDDEQSA